MDNLEKVERLRERADVTYEEAKEGLNTCLFGTGANQTSTTILYGQYTGADKVETDGCLYYWLASSNEYDNTNGWYVTGLGSNVYGCNFDYSGNSGVRPVIEVPESAIQQVQVFGIKEKLAKPAENDASKR